MSRDDTNLIDISRACHLAAEFAAGLDKRAFLGDIKTQSAVLHQLLVLGEAVKRLSLEFRDEHTQIPWKLIAGMRDRIIHSYDEVDLDEVWRTIESDLPSIAIEIEKISPRDPEA